MTNRMLVTVALLLPLCSAQSSDIDPVARKGIDAGNQAWITGMKEGRACGLSGHRRLHDGSRGN
jgi:hypothetical protein